MEHRRQRGRHPILPESPVSTRSAPAQPPQPSSVDQGLVSVERRGREAIYSLSDDHVAHIILDAMAHTQEPKTASAD